MRLEAEIDVVELVRRRGDSREDLFELFLREAAARGDLLVPEAFFRWHHAVAGRARERVLAAAEIARQLVFVVAVHFEREHRRLKFLGGLRLVAGRLFVCECDRPRLHGKCHRERERRKC